ncbi:MAG: DUF5668 domain-containing protein [Vicinamibacteria bacterium]
MEENVVRTDSGVDAPQPRVETVYHGSAHKRSPALAAFLSFFPGFGHLYNGEIGKALAFFCAFATCMFVMIEANGGVFFGLLLPFIVFYNMIDAYRSAERINLQSYSGVATVDEPASNRLWGWSLVAMGSVLLLHNMGLFRFEWVARMWPLLMIGAGVFLLRGSLFGSRQ